MDKKIIDHEEGTVTLIMDTKTYADKNIEKATGFNSALFELYHFLREHAQTLSDVTDENFRKSVNSSISAHLFFYRLNDIKNEFGRLFAAQQPKELKGESQ